MLPCKLIDLHLQPAELHDMADPGDPLSESEGPELVELPLGDTNLLTGHRASRPVSGRKEIAATLATYPEFLAALLDHISLLDLHATRKSHL